jgi:hypothetical protein
MPDILAGNLVVNLIAKIGDFQKNINNATGSLGKIARKVDENKESIQKMGFGLTAFGAAVSGAFGLMVREASEAEETQSKFFAVFKEEADAATQFIDDFATATGRSRVDLMSWTASLQDTFVPLGFARKNAREMSQELVQLAVDLSSFNNVAETDVMADLQSAMVGNHETMRKYGVIITETTLSQELMNMGIEKGTKGATEQEKAIARMNIILKGTTDAQGDAIRTSEGFANQLRATTSGVRDLAVTVGNNLLPILSSVLKVIQKVVGGLVEWAKAHPDLAKALTLVTAGVGALSVALGGFLLILPGLTAGLAALQVSLGPVAIAIGAVAAAVTLLITFWDELMAAFAATKAVLQPLIDLLVSGFTKAFDFIVNGWNFVLDTVKSIFTGIWDIISGVLSKVMDGFRWVLDKLGIELPALSDILGSIEESNESVVSGITSKWNLFKDTYKKNMEEKEQVTEDTNAAIVQSEIETAETVTQIDQAVWDKQMKLAADRIKTQEEHDKKLAEFRAEQAHQEELESQKLIVRTGQVIEELEDEWSDYSTERVSQTEAMMLELDIVMQNGLDTLGLNFSRSILTGGFSQGLKTLRQGFTKVFDDMKAKLIDSLSSALWDFLKSQVFKKALDALSGGLGGAFSNVLSGITGGGGIGGTLAGIGSTLTGGITGAGGAITGALGGIGLSVGTLGIGAAVGALAFGASKIFGAGGAFGKTKSVFNQQQEQLGHYLMLSGLGIAQDKNWEPQSWDAKNWWKANKNRRLANGQRVDDIYKPVWQPFINRFVKDPQDGINWLSKELERRGVLGVGLKGATAVSTGGGGRSTSAGVTASTTPASVKLGTVGSIAGLTGVSSSISRAVSGRNAARDLGVPTKQNVNNMNVVISGNNINSELDVKNLANLAGKEILQQVQRQETLVF